jgi:hypothetical protein
MDAVNPLEQPRRAWQYLPGQRRVKAAPDIAYDTPNPGSAGATTYDDAFVFNGAMDRYDFKLIGKKEMYVPYNGYKLMYAKDLKPALTANHVNPDFMRWELHRVWVVEATLKPGQRDLYGKRVFYLDEDTWMAVAADQYDAKGNLYRSTIANPTYSYDVNAANIDNYVFYDFSSGAYSLVGAAGMSDGMRYIEPLPELQWASESLAGAGVR